MIKRLLLKFSFFYIETRFLIRNTQIQIKQCIFRFDKMKKEKTISRSRLYVKFCALKHINPKLQCRNTKIQNRIDRFDDENHSKWFWYPSKINICRNILRCETQIRPFKPINKPSIVFRNKSMWITNLLVGKKSLTDLLYDLLLWTYHFQARFEICCPVAWKFHFTFRIRVECLKTWRV